ncbi:RND family efflux transporter MFP subunit [Arcticibacter tournemirensis]|uniref:Efflux RND transporter periplasmic adaptor subunit n=1 Tax=Arcticibacter tournemirensis TaxID=699437 RepID=A0A5M9H7K8_9SPHI|nr:efflux RND transporter periplasmic adaptor subunit [Arcticibacter tournemirensis]KAA8482923.1 efflux RND transporter periplasmic adaptor subunit [Arcticibacter tournemirensis]TQM49693.1 RND family efflux transporter MFP subunit [Arcticibacter tournemirensis]
MKINSILTPFILVIISSLTSCGSSGQTEQHSSEIKVSVKKIEQGEQFQELKYPGTIEPDNTAQIGFAVAGVVNNVVVQEGQHVKKGQLLASIDATEYSNALLIAKASLEQAEDMYQRLTGLYKKGSLPEKDYIDIKTKVAQARANKSINEKHIRDSKLYSPMTGIISNKMVETGSSAALGLPAFRIVKTDEVYVKVSVPESEVGAISDGMKASVFIATLNTTVNGKVNIINPEADNVSRTYTVKIKLGNRDGRLLPGMLADARISTGKQVKMIAVPSSSIVRDADNITYLFIAGNNRKATKRRVTVGDALGYSEVAITSGLAEGDQIIVAGQTRLKDGAAISF